MHAYVYMIHATNGNIPNRYRVNSFIPHLKSLDSQFRFVYSHFLSMNSKFALSCSPVIWPFYLVLCF